MKDGSKVSLEELKEFDKEYFEIDESSFEVNDGICRACNERFLKIVENRSIFDGSVTFHIIKLKCPKCNKEYLDLDQAEKYDFLLKLEKASKEEPLEELTKRIEA